MRYFTVVFCFLILFLLISTGASFAQKKQVLVVMSYEKDFLWVQTMQKGIEDILKPSSDITYFYMNTKDDLHNGPEMGRKAFELYRELRPDGVIAADDNAQSMFVVPYLKGKTSVPVIFTAVNGNPEDYGYPTEYITGMLERLHFSETIAFLKQLVPSVQNVCMSIKKSPVADILLKQIPAEKAEYLVPLIDIHEAVTYADTLAYAEKARQTCDALLIETHKGVTDAQGNPMPDSTVIPAIIKRFGKATASTSDYGVTYGALAAVVRTATEQGFNAANMLKQAMNGIPVKNIPIQRNRYGNRLINVNALKELGITPDPKLLRGATLVKTVTE